MKEVKRGRKKITTDVIVKKTTGTTRLKGKYTAEMNDNIEGYFNTIGEIKKYFKDNGIKIRVIRPKDDVKPKKTKADKTGKADKTKKAKNKIIYKNGDTVNVYGTVYEYNAEDNRFYVKGTENIDTQRG